MMNLGGDRRWAMLTSALVVLGIAAAPGDDAALRRLRAMPRERRLALEQQLEVFGRLPAAERERIRELDNQLGRLTAEERERYLDVLRLYESWLASLDPADRDALLSLEPGARMDRVRELLTRESPHAEGIDSILARFSNPSSPPLLDQVYWIRTWYTLDAERKSTMESLSWDERPRFLELWGRENGVADDRPAMLQRFQRDLRDRLQGQPVQKKLYESLTGSARERFSQRLFDARLLQDFTPEPISTANLERFAETLPEWVLSWIDPLPPRAAEERLRILYRLAFRPPEELPPTAIEARGNPATSPEAPPIPPPPPSPSSGTPF